MMRRKLALMLLPLALLTAGCSEVEQAANDAQEAAGEAVDGAVSDVVATATDEVVRQICRPLQDGQISAEDQQLLSGLVDTAETAGLPADITEPLGRIAEAGDQAPAEAVESLQETCDR